jgi:flagellar biogenesis protein FliO
LPNQPTPPPTRAQIPGWAVLLLAAVAVCAGIFAPALVGNGGSEDASAQPDLAGRLTRLYGAVVVILVLAVIGLYAGRRWLTGAVTKSGTHLAVLGGTNIGHRARVVLVRAMGRRLLAGIDARGLAMLVPVPESVPPEPADNATPQEAPAWRT